MYENVGRKIQIIGQVCGWLLLIAGIVLWIFMCFISGYSDDIIIGWISLAGGVVGFISSWFIYAFGQLVDDVHNIRQHTKYIIKIE